MGECPEWQRELTVNQPSSDFEGSSPSSPTTLRPDGLRVAQPRQTDRAKRVRRSLSAAKAKARSEEHTSELQSRVHHVCRLLFEKKKKRRRCRREECRRWGPSSRRGDWRKQ